LKPKALVSAADRCDGNAQTAAIKMKIRVLTRAKCNSCCARCRGAVDRVCVISVEGASLMRGSGSNSL
jgi:hypothetical protein